MSAPPATRNGDRAPAPLRVPYTPGAAASQATLIEQSRAAAQVVAQVMAAQAHRRDIPRAIAEMEEVCRIPALANRAFYRFPRGGQTVSGPTVALARELARCWGNLEYGINELSRGESSSEMQAFAWDLQTNTRETRAFIVPHTRDTREGTTILTDARDVYEANTSAGARRVREAIFAVLPVWFVERAVELCTETIRNGGGEPLPQRIAKAIKHYAEVWNVREGQLARKVGRPATEWTALDLAPLQVLAGALSRGEVNVAEEFPPDDPTATAADVAPARDAAPRERGARPTAAPAPAAEPAEDGAADAAASAPKEAAPEPAADPEPTAPAEPADQSGPAPQSMKTQIGRLLGGAGISEDSLRYAIASRLAGLPEPVATTNALTRNQAMRVLQALGAAKDEGKIEALVAAELAHWHADGHPTTSESGRTTRIPELANGECAICEIGEDQ